MRWPASVVRLRSRNRSTLTEAACRILDAWRPFTFEECGIKAFSVLLTAALDCDAAAPGGACRGSAPGSSGVEGAPARFVQHNTANPILWREDDNYVMDIVLRNNRTTPERPFGLFHVPERLFHIKKENIGLIEVMGLAVLPSRLKQELFDLADLLVARAPTAGYPEALQKHAEWAQDILDRHPELNADNVHLILQDEVGHVFAEVLADAGVYKMDEAGRAGFERFLASI